MPGNHAIDAMRVPAHGAEPASRHIAYSVETKGEGRRVLNARKYR
jgi:hypothetical protein